MIIQRNPAARVVYLHSEGFVAEMVKALQHGTIEDFKRKYRTVNALLIDDVQFFAGKERSQEEFFHTFNALFESQQQIILTSDRGPGEIPALQNRLVSRFNWGLVARIDRPCYETRVAIVHKKAKLRGIEMPDDVVCFIAATIDSNTRELEGAIARVAMLAQVVDRAIDLAVAQEALGADLVDNLREITIEDILGAVTSRYNVRLADLQSRKRSRSIAFPRQVCMYLARSLTRHSLEEIGGYFGGRDHTTVLHAQRSIESMAAEDPQLLATLDAMKQEIRSRT